MPNTRRSWGTIQSENLIDTDHVIVINPLQGSLQNVLVSAASNNFSVKYGDTNFSFIGSVIPAHKSAFEPFANSYNSFLVYGIKPAESPDVAPRMPFNRADYYIQRPTDNMPARCEPHTGILYKGTINHADGKHSALPLIDCVAFMQVVARVQNADGTFSSGSDLAALGLTTAAQIRSQLKEIRVYVIAQEGQKDSNYQSAATIDINDVGGLGVFKTFTVPDRNYRWKLYTLVISLYSLS
jgi:hypothetical protein